MQKGFLGYYFQISKKGQKIKGDSVADEFFSLSSKLSRHLAFSKLFEEDFRPAS